MFKTMFKTDRPATSLTPVSDAERDLKAMNAGNAVYQRLIKERDDFKACYESWYEYAKDMERDRDMYKDRAEVSETERIYYMRHSAALKAKVESLLNLCQSILSEAVGEAMGTVFGSKERSRSEEILDKALNTGTTPQFLRDGPAIHNDGEDNAVPKH